MIVYEENISYYLRHNKVDVTLDMHFEQDRPYIMAGIFQILSDAMAILPSISPPKLYRMADFTLWGCALAEALGYHREHFLQTYGENIKLQNEEVLQGDPLAAAVMAYMADKKIWEGRPKELLDKLHEVAEEEKINTRAKGWPKASNAMSRKLKEIKANLGRAGILFERAKSGDRYITLRRGENIAQTVQSAQGLSNQPVTPGASTEAINFDIVHSSPLLLKQNLFKNKETDDMDGMDGFFPYIVEVEQFDDI